MPWWNVLGNSVSLRKVEERDLETLLRWRNDVRVKSHMLNQHVITQQEHRNWFQKANAAATRHLYVVESVDGPFGFVHFDESSPQEAIWGFYKDPDAPSGCGLRLAEAALDQAFGPLNFARIRAQVLPENAASLAFHRKLGFKITDELQTSARNVAGNKLVLLELLSQDWRSYIN